MDRKLKEPFLLSINRGFFDTIKSRDERGGREQQQKKKKKGIMDDHFLGAHLISTTSPQLMVCVLLYCNCSAVHAVMEIMLTWIWKDEVGWNGKANVWQSDSSGERLHYT